jgi:hypothetical protein
MVGVDFKVVTTCVADARAKWWPSTGAAVARDLRDDVRLFEGEIQLPIELKPTTQLGHMELWVSIMFTISSRLVSTIQRASKYSLVTLPPEAPGFVPRDTLSLQTTIVEVATAYGRGPRPISMTPPQYEGTASASTASAQALARLLQQEILWNGTHRQQ